jgi:hypothetical protein
MGKDYRGPSGFSKTECMKLDSGLRRNDEITEVPAILPELTAQLSLPRRSRGRIQILPELTTQLSSPRRRPGPNFDVCTGVARHVPALRCSSTLGYEHSYFSFTDFSYYPSGLRCRIQQFNAFS